jgi:hypothetical protein
MESDEHLRLLSYLFLSQKGKCPIEAGFRERQGASKVLGPVLSALSHGRRWTDLGLKRCFGWGHWGCETWTFDRLRQLHLPTLPPGKKDIAIH